MKRLMIIALVAVPLTAQHSSVRTYTHPTCRYSFRHPGDWEVTPGGDRQYPCEVKVQPSDGSQSLWLDAGRGGFDRAMDATIFVRITDEVKKWAKRPDLTNGSIVVFGRKGLHKPVEIRIGALRGLRANDVALECDGEPDGGRLCGRDIAFVTDGHDWVNLDGNTRSAAFETALTSIVIMPRTFRTYVHPTCGYSFQHFSDWTVTPDPSPRRPCGLLVRPLDFAKHMEEDDVDTETVSLDAGEGDFEKGARAAGFVKVDEDLKEAYGGRLPPASWVVLGYGAYVTSADPIERNGLHGLRADKIECGLYHQHGGHAGLGLCSRAFLTNNNRWVTVSASWNSSDSFDLALQSVTLKGTP